MSRQQPPAQRGGKYPPGKAIYQDPAANMEESDSDEEIEDEVEFDLLEAMGDMTKNQRRRVYALKGLLSEYRQIKKQYEDEIAALAVKQLAEDREGYEERRKIISGERDVTEEEAKALTEAATKESGVEEVPSSDDEADAKKKGGADAKEKKSVKVVTPADQSGKSDLEKAGESATGGIPAFWLTAMKNNEVLEGMISERDEAALKYLTHVDTSFIDDSFKKGFTLVFHFAPNEFFTNETLTKRYLMVQEDGEDNSGDDDQTLDKIEGCDIDWKSVEKKLTVVIKQKKQRHKSGKGVRVVQREEKCPSFFHFFTAPVEPEDEEEEDEEELPYEDQLEMDYEAGLAFRQSLIPRAAHYYSGRSIDEIAAGFDYPTDDDEEEEEEEESEEEEVVPQRGGRGGGARGGARGGAPAQAPGKSGGKQPDCKQQ